MFLAPADDLPGAAERLMLEGLADLKARGRPAVEAFAILHPDDATDETRFLGHRTVIDRSLLARLGFAPVRSRGPVSLMRLPLGAIDPPGARGPRSRATAASNGASCGCCRARLLL